MFMEFTRQKTAVSILKVLDSYFERGASFMKQHSEIGDTQLSEEENKLAELERQET
jgi:hypothetical protein